MKVFKKLILTVIIIVLGVSANAYAITADEVVRKMDAHRLISDNFEMIIRVENYINNQIEGSTVMKGSVNNGKMTMLTYLEPMNMKDRKIVLKDNNMWLVIPNVKRPIRITASQRLVGGISYGDVAGLSYAEGYTAELNGEEWIVGMNLDGNKTDPNKCVILELSAKDRKTNYQKIVIWMDEQSFLPIKGDFFALSGKKMMIVYYTAPKEWNGKTILTKMFLFDQINTTKHFSMEYSDINATQTNDNLESLSK